ncbi:MAG: MFS transporter [Candidatus Binatia bacterium]
MSKFIKSSSVVHGLVPLYSSTFLSAGWAMIIPAIPALAQQFGVSAGGAAQIVTAFAIGKFFGTIVAGVILDRMGTRIALVGGPLVASVASLSAAGAPRLSLILFLALIMGAADSLWSTAREVAGVDLARSDQRGRVISSLHGTYNLGGAFAPLLGGWLTDLFSFKAAFIGYAVAGLLSVFLGLISPDSAVPSMPQKNRNAVRGRGLAAIRQRLRRIRDLYREIHPNLRATYLVLILATLASQSQRIIVQSMLPLYAGIYLQLSATEIGMLFTISGIIVFAMIIPAGFIMDRIGRKWCTVPSTGLPALVFVLIPATGSFTQLAILVAVAGLSQGLSLGSLATSTYDVAPAHARGRLQAVRRTIAELGSGIAPVFGGYLANTFNPGVPFLVYAPLLIVSATLLAVIGRETLER